MTVAVGAMVAVGSEVAVAATGVGTTTGTEVGVDAVVEVGTTSVDVRTGVEVGSDVPVAGTSAAVASPALQATITNTSKNADIVTFLWNWTRN